MTRLSKVEVKLEALDNFSKQAENRDKMLAFRNPPPGQQKP
jgi:hypothetical protein